jgi:short-subunit dehydrogenase
LLRAGSDLVLVARSADRLESLAEELRITHHVHVTTLPADLVRTDEVRRVVSFTSITPIDVLVNNAGMGIYGEFAEIEPSREHDIGHGQCHDRSWSISLLPSTSHMPCCRVCWLAIRVALSP